MAKNKYSDDSYLDSFQAVEVKVVDGNINEAIARFRALVTKERIMSSIKEHCAYEKPSDKKRRKQREAAQQMRKAEKAEAFARRNREVKEE